MRVRRGVWVLCCVWRDGTALPHPWDYVSLSLSAIREAPFHPVFLILQHTQLIPSPPCCQAPVAVVS